MIFEFFLNCTKLAKLTRKAYIGDSKNILAKKSNLPPLKIEPGPRMFYSDAFLS